MISDKKTACDHCGLPVEIRGIEVLTTEGLKKFCCEGCKSIYYMMHNELLLPDTGRNLADDSI